MMYAMARIFKAEMNRLRREESGVALMLTLSVVLLLYVLCAGVYAVGETARQKIEIQNACDAAAYSAALVEADGLSRMAMVNRALAWTYITLTNIQIDYLTYKWLQLVERRFSEDWTMCATWAGQSSYRGWGGSECPECNALKQQDVGWFCGVAGAGTDYVRLNGSQTPVPISVIRETLQNMQHIEAAYPQCILLFKESIRQYNGCLLDVALKMNKAIPQTAMAVLRQNLPRLSPGGLDERARDDFFGYCHCPTFFTPYEKIEVEGNAEVGNVMSPLYNTELDERLFLTMADGEVHDNLADYFGPSGDDSRRFGGLDQWFVRSHEAETRADAPVVERTADSYKALGICRVYKNANRMGDEPLPAYRAHHGRLGREDSRPSCVNTRSYCPDQCREAPDTVAPYAEYEWCAGRYKYRCFHVRVPSWPNDIDIHFHYFDSKFLRTCGVHGCQGCVLPSESHTRSAYKSCWSKGKKLYVIEPFSGRELMPWPPVYPGNIDSHWWTTRATVQLSVATKPNGFARIYGDDWEICNTNTFAYYTGEVAMPWILNDKYYSGGGSIVVGLARRQRNPWSVLLNGFSAEAASPSATAEGIYSAFDPVADGYLVAFSAARAAHRFNPSLQQREKYGVAKAPAGEYETRYDAVCDDALDASGALGRFNIRQDDGDLLKSRVGCVCKDVDNERRFARCWNLCETDWDATLLPLKYSGFGLSTEWHDSLSGPSEVWWATEAALGDTGRNAFALAALDDDEGRPKWIPFSDGDRLPGRFLSLAAPPRPGTDVVPSPSMQDILPDATPAESPADDPSPYDTPDDGHLDVKTLIRTRIL